MALVVLGVMPVLTLIAYTGQEERAVAEAEAQAEALRIARLLASEQSSQVGAARQLLLALAHTTEIQGRNPQACSTLLAALLVRNPTYANLAVAGLDGDTWCSAIPPDSATNVSDRRYFQDALLLGGFAVGAYQVGRITRRPSVNAGYPVADADGITNGVVYVALDLGSLTQHAAGFRLPEGAAISVFDQSGTILVHQPEPERWVGQTVPDASLLRAVASGPSEATIEAPGFDGVVRLYAYAALGLPAESFSAFAAVGIPRSVAFVQVDRILARNLGGLTLALVIGLAAAWFVSDVLILRWVRALVHATQRVSAGDLTARAEVSRDAGELAELARAFDQMAESLERHEKQRAVEEELRRQNEALEAENRRVEEANRLKTEFVSFVSHELRTPLTSIKGYVDLLLEGEGGRLEPRHQQLVGIVRKNAERLVTLTGELLDVSRMEAGKIELHLDELDMRRLIQQAVDTVRPLVESKQQHLTVRVPEGLPYIAGDAQRVAQILTNLLSNATKYTHAGGSVSVTAHAEDAQVRIDVADNGVGLSPEEQANLFTRFYRAKNEATRGVAGTGLGLAITRSLVELHGGTINVASEPGRGSTFSFTLPVAAAGR